VTWTRVLQNDWKNPQVGRDALIGAGLGVLFITWIALMQLFVLKIGDSGPEDYYLGSLLGANHVLGMFFSYFGSAIGDLTGLLLLCLFLRALLRKEWLVAIAFVLLLSFKQTRGTNLPFLLAFAVNSGNFLILILALSRFGLFAAIVMLAVTNTLGDGLMTTDFSAWYGTSSWMAIVVVVTVALWGYRVSTGGKPLLAEAGPSR